MIRLFRVFVPRSVVALVLSDAILLCSCYLGAAFLVLEPGPESFLRHDHGWARIAIVVLCLMIAIYFEDLYTEFRVRSKAFLIQQVGVALGVAFLAQALLAYGGAQKLYVPTWLMIAGSALVFILLPLWRVLFGDVVFKAVGSVRVLFLGSSCLVKEICDHLAEHPETGLYPIGCLADTDVGDHIGGAPVLGGVANLDAVVQQLNPDRIVVGMAERRNRLPVHQLLNMHLGGIHIEDAANTYEAMLGRISTRELRPAQLIFSSELGPNRKHVLLQSIYSMAIAAVAMIVTLPLMLAVAAAIRLSSRGPALFKQQRIGKNNVPFTLYKFRSMRRDAEAVSGAVWAKKNDPRITWLGYWLRKLRLDELPQLFNVLKGDMSIAGPRPERPEFVAELEKRIPFYRQRHCVKPGITGWAQINHKYSDSVEDTVVKLEYDLYYIKNLSPSLDAVIMFHTAKVMLLSRGSQ